MAPGKSINDCGITFRLSELANERDAMRSAGEKAPEARERILERAHRSGERKSYVPRRAECGARHDRDAGLVDELFAQLDVGFHALRLHRGLDVREEVERSVGRHTCEPGQLADSGEEHV